MRKWAGTLAVAMAAAVLTACGGGGGSPGETHAPYQIALRADLTTLPANIANVPPGIGSPFTTTLYVSATEDGRPIPGGAEVFSCATTGGLDSGRLYYLDGAHDEEDGGANAGGFRSVVLGSNSGGATFHFESGAVAGTTQIVCSVTDPRDQRVHTAGVSISVGAATGMPASVFGVAQAPAFLGTRFNGNSIPNNVGIQTIVLDDAGQYVPNPDGNNLQIAIVGGDAAPGARLLLGNQDSEQQSCTVPRTRWAGTLVPCIRARTLGGIAQFSLSSGRDVGTIMLALTVDRLDNDVQSIAMPITQLLAIPVVTGIATEPLAAEALDIGSVGRFDLIANPLAASGGVPPYTWSCVVEPCESALPSELDLDPSGIIVGTVSVPPGAYSFLVRVMDQNKQAVDARVSLTVTPSVPVIEGGAISVTEGDPFAQALTVSGGRPEYTWSLVGNKPAGIGIDAEQGILSGTAPTAGNYAIVVKVVDSDGQSALANVQINVSAKPEQKSTSDKNGSGPDFGG